MKTQRTIYHLIVDRSGSMSDCINQTINGFNEQIKSIRALEETYPEQELLIGLTLFNQKINHLHIAEPVNSIPLWNEESFRPNGNTALLDAIGVTSTMLSEKEKKRNTLPTTYVIVILTDGYENSSEIYTLAKVRSLIEALESTGNWTFSFIGATMDAVEVAKEISIKASNSFSFSKESMQTSVWNKLSGSMKNYAYKKRNGGFLSDLFDDES